VALAVSLPLFFVLSGQRRCALAYNRRRRNTTPVPIGESERLRTSWEESMKKVLFICTANICRSPMAQAIFDVSAEDEGLPLRSESVGTAALEARSIAPNAITALGQVGISPGPHGARRVSSAMVGGRSWCWP
jgi:hypothetical protein